MSHESGTGQDEEPAEAVDDPAQRRLGDRGQIVGEEHPVLAALLAPSRFGRIRLGRDGERPEFSTASWVAMMFSAGMGIGLMFCGE
ncbi:BCCT family transporter [Streptomyces sp. S.PNR 29]|nr:BCCT family transporter [Streptomyces sp. S.PNR 29]MDN0196751.1 BCCT family transporter [Streptomyces sp. S.PNR 29]